MATGGGEMHPTVRGLLAAVPKGELPDAVTFVKYDGTDAFTDRNRWVAGNSLAHASNIAASPSVKKREETLRPPLP